MIILSIFSPLIRSKNNIKEAFTYTSGRGGGYHYVVQLDNYRNPFKIKADFIDDKIKEKFENTIKKGEQLTLQIPRSNKDDLNSNDLNFIYSMKSSQHEYLSSNDPIFIYSMKSPQHEYLSSNDTINAHNSKRMLYVGFGFFLAGILYSVFRKRYLASKTTAQKNAES